MIAELTFPKAQALIASAPLTDFERGLINCFYIADTTRAYEEHFYEKLNVVLTLHEIDLALAGALRFT